MWDPWQRVPRRGCTPWGRRGGDCTSSWGCSLGLTASSGLGVFITLISEVLQELGLVRLVPGCWDVAGDIEACRSALLPPERTPCSVPRLKGDLWAQGSCSSLVLLCRLWGSKRSTGAR